MVIYKSDKGNNAGGLKNAEAEGDKNGQRQKFNYKKGKQNCPK